MELTKAERMTKAQETAQGAAAQVAKAVRQHQARKNLRRVAADAATKAPGRDAVRDAQNADAQTHAVAIADALTRGEEIIRAAGFAPTRAMGSSGETVLRVSVGNAQVGPDYSGSDDNLRRAAKVAMAARNAIAAAMQAWRESRK